MLESFFDGVDLDFVVTRDEFETLCQDLFQSCLELAIQAIQGARLDKGEVAEVILTGEASRIPRFRVLLADFLGKTVPFNTTFQGDAAVRGAAIFAAMLIGHTGKLLEGTLLDVMPKTLGVETVGNVITPIIRRNTLIPTNREEEIWINVDADPALHIYQSETKDNNFLFSSPLPGIESFLGEDNRGVAQIGVKFEVDGDMRLRVVATFRDGTNRRVANWYLGGRTGEEVHLMMTRMERLKDMEKEFQQSSARLRDWLRSYSDRLGAAITEQQEGLEFNYARIFGATAAEQQGLKKGLTFTIEEKNIIRRALEPLNEFLGHSLETTSVEECRELKERVERMVNPVLIAASHRHLGISPAPWGNAYAMDVDM